MGGALLEKLDEPKRDHLYYQTATVLMAQPGAQDQHAAQIGQLLLAAHQNEAALKYLLAAARYALTRHDGAQVLGLTDQILAQLSSLESAETWAAWEARGDALRLLTRYQEALGSYQKARIAAERRSTETSDAKIAYGELMFKEAEAQYIAGDLPKAARLLAELLARLGYTAPKGGRVRTILGIAFQLFLQMLHTLFPALFIGRKAGREPDGRALLATRSYKKLMEIEYFQDFWKCIQAGFTGLNYAEQLGPSVALAEVWISRADSLGLWNAGAGISQRRTWASAGDRFQRTPSDRLVVVYRRDFTGEKRES